MSKLQLSIIILNYNSEQFCEQCLQSIQKYPPSCEYEIILVDNNSQSDEFSQLQKEWTSKLPIQFLPLSKNRGYGQGNEQGIQVSKGEHIAILNPDVQVQADTFNGLIQYLESNKKVGLVAPKLLYPDGKLQDSFRRFPRISDMLVKRMPIVRSFFQKRLRHFLMWDIDLNKSSRVDWVVGAFFIARREAWEEVGGFDPRYFLFLEDTDVCRSLWKKGWQVIFHPGYTAKHYHQRLSDTTGLLDIVRKKTVRIHLASALKYFWKWRGRKTGR